MTDLEKFESLKKKINAIKVKKLASEAEAKRLSSELEKCKEEIRKIYGVEIEDFAKAIETMKNEQKEKLAELESLVEDAEKKIGGLQE